MLDITYKHIVIHFVQGKLFAILFIIFSSMEICNIRDFPPFPSWYISLLSSTFLLLFDSASIYLFNFLFQHLHRWSNFIYERECNNKSGATLNCASKCLLILQIFGEYIYIYWLTYYTYSSIYFFDPKPVFYWYL